MKIAILGAGLTGLELGRRLHLLGIDFIIFEKENCIGGLAKTIKTNGYSWDYGVHAMYSKDGSITNYYNHLPIDLQRHVRRTKILHKGRFISYPFENGIGELPPKDRLECITGYLKPHRRRKYSDLQDWIDNRLGYGISKHFMKPYNQKIWNCSLSEISTDLVSGKIDPMSLPSFILSVLGRKTIGREYQSNFIYPKAGIQGFINYTADCIQDRIRINSGIRNLGYKKKQWFVNGIKFDRIISTIPLPELLKLLDLPKIQKEYKKFKWNDTFFVMVGLKEGKRFGKFHDLHWAFFKENEIFYRLTFMHNFSENFPPAVVAEVTDRGMNSVKEFVIYDLLNKKVIESGGDISAVTCQRIQYTYPIPTLNADTLVGEIEKELQNYNLHLLGRSGRWRYINMDDVIKEVDEYASKNFGNNRGN